MKIFGKIFQNFIKKKIPFVIYIEKKETKTLAKLFVYLAVDIYSTGHNGQDTFKFFLIFVYKSHSLVKQTYLLKNVAAICQLLVTTEYLVCKPLLFNTAWIHFGIERQSFSQYYGMISWTHVSLITCFKWVSELGLCAATFCFKTTQQFSMGLRSGEFPGQGPRI